PQGAPAPAPRPNGGFQYQNCDAARDAGAAPVYRDEYGYGPHLDRDNDGIGCE
ncbi:excalibur calcium-binding domain-containing protein, partial [Rhodococcus fascians]|nr:excalibur calcium-binding domain-containing protein [Rhodococcus fascians]MBY4266365.1 excalibur calcium-binding domain-containing protein [Rhodococcus fascians]MBY4434075.1 excalibur calcium-binding domain-containing protein [Rhodococcus fascians]